MYKKLLGWSLDRVAVVTFLTLTILFVTAVVFVGKNKNIMPPSCSPENKSPQDLMTFVEAKLPLKLMLKQPNPYNPYPYDLEANIEKAKNILRENALNGFSLPNDCVMDKIVNRNAKIMVLPSQIMGKNTGAGTIYEQTFDVEYVENGKKYKKKMDVFDTVVIPDNAIADPTYLSVSIVHELVHVCQYEELHRKNVSAREHYKRYVTFEGYVEAESPAYDAEFKYLDFIISNGSFVKNLEVYPYNIYNVINMAQGYCYYKNDDLLTVLKQKHSLNF